MIKNKIGVNVLKRKMTTFIKAKIKDHSIIMAYRVAF